MLPSPLHPAVVHFPIVLMILLPLMALGALWTIRRGVPARRAWALPVLFAVLLSISSWAALETGEQAEEGLEDRVGEAVLEDHEESAERFLWLSLGVMLLTGVGLASGRVGRASRIVGTAAALALVVAGYQVGHTGGRIVYGDATTTGLVGAAASSADGRLKVSGDD
jgi:uncharacterized membrane protein